MAEHVPAQALTRAGAGRIERARERERGLRERLEGDDISHLLAAQRAQAESLRKENEALRQEVQDAQADRDGSEAIRKLRLQLDESEARCKELASKNQDAEQQGQQARNALLRADAASRANVELERKVKGLTAQLQAASGDLDDAAQHALAQKQEMSALKREMEMQQIDIVSLQKQLGVAATEDEAQRMVREEEMNMLRLQTVSKQELELAQQDNLALKNKNAELLQQTIQQENDMRLKVKDIGALEVQLKEATGMWHAAARDCEDLRKRVRELEDREPQIVGEVGRKEDELLGSNRRIAALIVDLHAMSGRLAHFQAENADCQRRIRDMADSTVTKDTHARYKETMERALQKESDEKLALKLENEQLRERLGHRAASSVGNLTKIHDQLVGLENTMQFIEQAGFTLKTDAVQEVARLRHSNEGLQHSMSRVAKDLELKKSDVQMQVKTLKGQAQHESQRRGQEQKELHVLKEAMNEIDLRLLQAEDSACASEQYLRDAARLLRVNPANTPSSVARLDSTRSLAKVDSATANKQGRSPIQRLFLDLESAADSMDQMYVVGSQQGQRLEAYQNKVKELEKEIFELRSSTMPLNDYKELTKELASECDNVRKFTQEHVAARFQHQLQMIDELKRERDSALDRVTALERSAQRHAIVLEQSNKSSAALNSRAKMLEKELDAARRAVDSITQQKEEASQVANDLHVRHKYLQQERDQAEVDLRSAERDITKLKSVIKVATDAVRKAAEQRQNDAVLKSQDARISAAGGNEDHLRLQVLEISKEREDLATQLRVVRQQEAQSLQQLQRAFAAEAEAKQELSRARRELEGMRAVNESMSKGVVLENAEPIHEGEDSDSDIQLPPPPSQEKRGVGERPAARVSAVESERARLPRPSTTRVKSEEEDEYVRQVSKSLGGSRANTPSLSGGDGVDANASTTGTAGSFLSAGDVENRLFAHR